MLRAQDVLHAYTMISISIMVVFTSLTQPRDGEKEMGGAAVRGFRARKQCWNFHFQCVFCLTWTPSGSQTHLCLAPTLGSVPAFLWKQIGCEKERSRTGTHTHTFRHTHLPHNKASEACQFH